MHKTRENISEGVVGWRALSLGNLGLPSLHGVTKSRRKRLWDYLGGRRSNKQEEFSAECHNVDSKTIFKTAELPSLV